MTEVADTTEVYNATRSKAVRASRSHRIPITRGVAKTLVYGAGVLLWLAVPAGAWLMVHKLGGTDATKIVAVVVSLVFVRIAIEVVLGGSGLDDCIEDLGTWSDYKERRNNLQLAVQAGSSVENLARRLTKPDSRGEWVSLDELDDGVEELVSRWDAVWSFVRKADSGDLPAGIIEYLRELQVVMATTLRPEIIAGAVERLMVGRGKLVRGAEAGLSGFVFAEVNLRTECRTNLDWAAVNAWCAAGKGHVRDAGYRPGGETSSGRVSQMLEELAGYLTWWSLPRGKRNTRFRDETVLLLAPAVVFEKNAGIGFKEYGLGPLTISHCATRSAENAPIEYVARLWETYPENRVGEGRLDRVVEASKKLSIRRLPARAYERSSGT